MTTTINASTSAGLISSADTSGILQLQTANTAAVTIDASQNVGVGTSSPQVQLHLQSSAPVIRLTDTSASTDAEIFCNSAAGSMYLRADQTNVAANSVIGFQIDGSDKMTLDSAGNLGLGVTPSAWGGAYKALQFGIDGVLNATTSTTNGVILAKNFFNNGAGNKYINTDFASFYQQISGQHQWFTAPSGTAGNAITFTQAMTLGSSGDLLLGTTTNRLSEKLHVLGYGITVSSAENTNLGMFGNFGSANLIIGAFNNFPVEFRQNNTERMRIDTSGNLLVGQTSSTSGYKLQIGSSGNTGNNILLRNNGTEELKMLFAGSGLTTQAIGVTTASRIYIYSNYDTATGQYMTSGATSWTSTSDERLKENLVAISGATQKISTLRAVVGNYISDETKKPTPFLIAQDVQAVFPEAVDNSDPDVLGLSYTAMIPLLVAAIKEQNQIIQQLQADVAALKGTP